MRNKLVLMYLLVYYIDTQNVTTQHNTLKTVVLLCIMKPYGYLLEESH